jgi:hypothetical protein
MLRKLALSLSLVACATMPLAGVAEASIADSAFVPANQMERVAPLEDANFIHGGIPYCWYPNGWRGPGFYLCGWARRSGLGWGGGWGWNGWGGGWSSGWNGRGWRRGMRPPGNRPGNTRPGNNRPGANRPNRPGSGGNRPRSDIPSIHSNVATATFDYASIGVPAYAVVRF